MTDTQGKTIFLSACEASADIHSAHLIDAIRKILPDANFVGIGGDHMKQAGCEIIENPVQRAAMTYKAFAQVGFYIKLLKRVKKYFQQNPVDLVIVCDSPAFNFHTAKAAKKADIKTFFYVAPQLWAWAPWRIRKLRKCCDRLACILPFEKEWFGKRNMNCEFVGNPLLAGLAGQIEPARKNYENYNVQNAKVALIPGSRKAELESIWPTMQEVAAKLKNSYPNIKFTAVAFNDEAKLKLQDTQLADFECEYSINSVLETCRNSDFAMVTSGSATLEVAAAGCPMVIMYHVNKFLWNVLGRFIILTKYFSLVNILAQKEVVTEFMPYLPETQEIYDKVNGLLTNPEQLKHTSSELVDITKPLANKNAPEEAAKMIASMLK